MAKPDSGSCPLSPSDETVVTNFSQKRRRRRQRAEQRRLAAALEAAKAQASTSVPCSNTATKTDRGQLGLRRQADQFVAGRDKKVGKFVRTPKFCRRNGAPPSRGRERCGGQNEGRDDTNLRGRQEDDRRHEVGLQHHGGRGARTSRGQDGRNNNGGAPRQWMDSRRGGRVHRRGRDGRADDGDLLGRRDSSTTNKAAGLSLLPRSFHSVLKTPHNPILTRSC